MSQKPVLSVVVPCYNEEEVLEETANRLLAVLAELERSGEISKKSHILFVDDGSRDATWQLIKKRREASDKVKGIKLARNAGHQNALLAGLMKAKGESDAAPSIDADLQDDESKIQEFVAKMKEGCDVVYGVRSKRDTDTAFKRLTAVMFYKIMKKMGADIVENHADYRLMSKRALGELEKFDERHLFLRGIVPLIGFKSAEVFYERKERFAGESKYPFKKMVAFAMTAATSFSAKPVRWVTGAGFAMLFVSFAMIAKALLDWAAGHTVQGWTSTVVSIWFIGGAQTMAAGLIGEYVAKIYEETKKRPKYIVEEELG